MNDPLSMEPLAVCGRSRGSRRLRVFAVIHQGFQVSGCTLVVCRNERVVKRMAHKVMRSYGLKNEEILEVKEINVKKPGAHLISDGDM